MDVTPNAKGFTLIELVLVMVVMALLVAVTATRWNAGDATASYQADLLARNIRHMQILAMTWGQSLRLSVASPSYSVSCVTASAAPPCNASPVFDPASGKVFSETLVNGVTLAGANLDIDSLGRPVSGGVLLTANRVYALAAGAQTWSVTIGPITGFAAVTSP